MLPAHYLRGIDNIILTCTAQTFSKEWLGFCFCSGFVFCFVCLFGWFIFCFSFFTSPHCHTSIYILFNEMKQRSLFGCYSNKLLKKVSKHLLFLYLPQQEMHSYASAPACAASLSSKICTVSEKVSHLPKVTESVKSAIALQFSVTPVPLVCI